MTSSALRGCMNCVNYAEVGPRCRVCYEYKRRNGKERPQHLARRQPELNRRRFDRRLTG